jgi:hypothetical protein
MKWSLNRGCQSYPYNRPWRPIGLWEVDASTFCRQSAYRWWWGYQPYTPAVLYPHEELWYSFLLRGWVDPRAIVRLEGLGKLKKSNDIGNRTRVLLACSIVPRPITLPCAPIEAYYALHHKHRCACLEVNKLFKRTHHYSGCSDCLPSALELQSLEKMGTSFSSLMSVDMFHKCA